ncbi:ergothioneine biosynthesis protein EgtB [Algoriphagus sediminis]|uniref:Ergothioneine biosynthesis protein EgtB n=1 Tax=Algoriphagus sediminis TaxID=3057113 RepID=A0ABT7YBD5_9BACT|nr:ergothioneine biosynthesis protein EgtB [Algoriphagus sediminis]MDN3203715.1 ergothioneine biosynthesis protein EgtB [Algoriphagus sediminis]
MNTRERYLSVRQYSLDLCKNLIKEDFGLQASEEVSPPKWHLAHTTWFFEQFILINYMDDYKVAHPQFNFLFNSYYNTHGNRTARNQRGLMSRPGVDEVLEYRKYVDEAMLRLIEQGNEEVEKLVILGTHHEQQHQELLITDLKFSIWHNPLDVQVMDVHEYPTEKENGWVEMSEGLYQIGHRGDGFCFDNELGPHKVFLQPFSIGKNLVSNEEYLAFVESDGYQNPKYWHDEGWAWVKRDKIDAPLYWEKRDGKWTYYTLNGREEIDPKSPVAHVSFYEASAYAMWKGLRLPTEFEWEASNERFKWGSRWEWTNSAYLAYPGFKIAPGALGEYNGKFMVNQMVLRGASIATSPNHSRATYRNFFHPHLRWQFMGIRLAK